MISSAEVDTLKMYCRGSQNCCGKENNRICAEGEAGDGGVGGGGDDGGGTSLSCNNFSCESVFHSL